MASNKTIVLKGDLHRWHEEYVANAALKPGHLLELMSTGKVRKSTVYGGSSEPIFAKENSYTGGTRDTAYSALDNVFAHYAQRGDRINTRVAALAPSIAIGDRIISAGDGTVVKAPSNTGNTLYQNTAASAAISNTTVETAFDKSYTIPANTLKAGDFVRIRGQAIATSTANTDTLLIKVYLGSTSIGTSGAVNATNSDVVVFDLWVVIRTIGTSGTYVSAGSVGVVGAAGTATMRETITAETAIDTTVTNAITVKATWSVADTADSVRLDILNVSIDRQNGFYVIGTAMEAVDNSAGSDDAFLDVRIL